MTRITIDLDAAVVEVENGGKRQELPLASNEGFAEVSRAWVRAGWDVKYVYSFTWLGRPIIQLPDDLIRLQEVIYAVRPDVIVETGIAHGGSLVFSASMCRLLGKGRVIGIDIEIRPHNRAAIEGHELADLITMIEGGSTSPAVVERVADSIAPGETVLVLLDSDHSRDHVRAELEAYGPLVSNGSYIVAMDGVMGQVAGGPRTEAGWVTDNPQQAALEFAAAHPEFTIHEPTRPFDEGLGAPRVTYWPDAFLRRES